MSETIKKEDGSTDWDKMQQEALKRLNRRAPFPVGSIHHPNGTWGALY